MSFTRTGPNSARTDTFEVKIAKRDQLHYIDASGITVVPIEIGGDRVIAIWISQITNEKRQEVRKGIVDALEFLSIPHRFDV